MAELNPIQEPAAAPKKRKMGTRSAAKKSNKKFKTDPSVHGKKIRIDRKMKKLFRKRAREYNSDDDEFASPTNIVNVEKEDVESEESSEEIEAKVHHKKLNQLNSNINEDDMERNEDGAIQPGITKFTEGCRAFQIAFKNIIKKSISDDLLGPVLSGHKKLIAENLAEEEAERKVKGEAKKEKHLLAEKGHVKPDTYLNSHEKFLISVATKGVVKLFNAVNKAQTAQKGLDPSRSKDAKVIRKRRKEAFFSELGKSTVSSTETSMKATGDVKGEGPGWAPLRDNFMLTNPKLKDWDKMADDNGSDDIGNMDEDSSSEDD